MIKLRHNFKQKIYVTKKKEQNHSKVYTLLAINDLRVYGLRNN